MHSCPFAAHSRMHESSLQRRTQAFCFAAHLVMHLLSSSEGTMVPAREVGVNHTVHKPSTETATRPMDLREPTNFLSILDSF